MSQTITRRNESSRLYDTNHCHKKQRQLSLLQVQYLLVIY